MTVPNPPAFPSEQHECLDGSWNQTYGDGMSLRDWFAGQALTSVMGTAQGLGETTPAERAESFKLIALWVYEHADAMLAERSRP